MKFQPLGTSELRISELCLGSMTFGQHNTPEEAIHSRFPNPAP